MVAARATISLRQGKAVRARSDSQIGLGAPVRQVMPRLVAGGRVVGDFVHRVAACGNFIAHRRVHRGLFLIRQGFHPPAFHLRKEGGSFFEGKVVGGDVIGFERGGLSDVIDHAGDGLSRNRENQIEIETSEARAMGQQSGFARFGGVVNSAQELEDSIVEGLRAEADSIDSRRPHPGELGEVHGARISFQRYFRIAIDPEAAIGRVENRSDRVRREQ